MPLLLGLGACSSPPEFVWEGEHVRFAADDADQVCAGTLAYLDRRAGELGSRLSTTASIDYHWLPDGVQDTCPPGEDVVGCAIGDEVFSAWVPHDGRQSSPHHPTLRAVVSARRLQGSR